ncbi:acyl-CoA dehydrogenase family protein [Jatrophihabitans sp. DSM 45814]
MTDMESVDDFRLRAKTWLAENMELGSAAPYRAKLDDYAWADFQRELQRRVFDGGFAGIRYPSEYGGQGLTEEHQTAFTEAASPYVMPVQYSVTHGILGPTLLDFGTEEQKKRYLPPMLAGDMWVQFLSEPSGGSDMAGAITRAVRDGDTYVINGAKIWSTSAHFADYAMALCRTNGDVPKHRGLSMIIVPIRHPGVTVMPIKLVDGTAHFCQEFFDDAVIPAENLLGSENDGWTVASRLLFHERSMVGGNSLDDTPRASRTQEREDELVRLAKDLGKTSDPTVRQRLGEAIVLARVERYALKRIDGGIRSGRIPGPGASMLKLMHAVIEYRRSELAFEIAGSNIASWADEAAGAQVGTRFLAARTSTVAGGTNEMQRNQISERVLGLPREVNPDKDVPFNQTTRNTVRPTK